MSYDFNNKVSRNKINQMSLLGLDSHLAPEERERLTKIQQFWNFYEGYHWEDIQDLGERPQITENYCRSFVNKFVSFEFGSGIRVKSPMEDNDDTTPITDFLNEVWSDNNKESLCIEMGQTKSVTGFSCLQVKFEKSNEVYDPFGEYAEGRIRLVNVPSHIVFPKFDHHDKDKLVEVTIAYPIEVEESTPVLRKSQKRTKLYKQIWTPRNVTIEDGSNAPITIPNKYGVIPFVLIGNYPMSGRAITEYQSDLEDLIPLNIELNTKTSDVSEIIDYYSAPITILYGAKVSALEKGANKLWGGLPKDARVQNLELQSDLSASNNYRNDLKSAMHQIGSVPEGALGGQQAISNTSSVALTIANMPIIERTRIKRDYTSRGLKTLNKLILHIALMENLITIPEKVNRRQFFTTEILFPDILPKDKLLELQQIQTEMQLGMEYRKKAMERMGKSDLVDYLNNIDKDIEEHPEFYGLQPKQELNSGFNNGDTTPEMINKEMNGQNVNQNI